MRRHVGAQTQPRNVLQRRINEKPTAPGTRMVIMSSIQLMQNRITRVNFAVDPPDIMITPRLGGVRMLDFDQVENVIEEGYIAAQHKVSDIEMLLKTHHLMKTLDAFFDVIQAFIGHFQEPKPRPIVISGVIAP